jgi:DNA-binding HxlR family transcriptional regulator
MSSEYISSIIEALKISVQEKNVSEFRKIHFKLTNLCRASIIEADKKMLSESYPEISSFIVWFYKTGTPLWPEVDRMVGGIDALLGIVGNIMDTHTAKEVLADIKGSKDWEVLVKLHDKPEGILSGELARQLKRSPNALTNRLPGLERKGIIIRAKRGKNSLIYLTPKGKYVAKELVDSLDQNRITRDVPIEEQPSGFFMDIFIQGQPNAQIKSFWIT